MTGERNPLRFPEPGQYHQYLLLWRKWVLLQFSDAMGCKRGDIIKFEVGIGD